MLTDPTTTASSRPDPSDVIRVEVAQTSGSRVRISVGGELDLGTAPVLAAHLQDALERRYAQVDLDLRQLGFCDAAGLNLLMGYNADLRGRGGQLTVNGPCPAVQRLLDILGASVDLRLTATPADRPPAGHCTHARPPS